MLIHTLIRHYDESSELLMVSEDPAVVGRELKLWMEKDMVSDFVRQTWRDGQIVHEDTWHKGYFVKEYYPLGWSG